MMTLSQALTEYVLVTDNNTLAELCVQWQHCSVLALDTEFIRIDTFHPRLGLIQVCDGQTNYLLDPLAITHWAAFSNILDNPRVLKSLHSCSEDLVVFKGFFRQGAFPTVRYPACGSLSRLRVQHQLPESCEGSPWSRSQQGSDTLGLASQTVIGRATCIRRAGCCLYAPDY